MKSPQLLSVLAVMLCLTSLAPAQESTGGAAQSGGAAEAAPSDEGTPAPAAVPDDETAAMRQELADLRKQVADLNTRIAELQATLNTVVRDHRDLVEEVARISTMDGARVLANLNTDPVLRDDLVRAANPVAEIRFHNWYESNRRMQINGTWHNLLPGENTIPVPYGPVTVTECDKKDPITFNDWSPTRDGYVMVFDIGRTTSR